MVVFGKYELGTAVALNTNDGLTKIETRVEGGNYFEELLARIRDIRSSEKVFWRKVLDIYATSIDYDPKAETPSCFSKSCKIKCIGYKKTGPRLKAGFIR